MRYSIRRHDPPTLYLIRHSDPNYPLFDFPHINNFQRLVQIVCFSVLHSPVKYNLHSFNYNIVLSESGLA